MLASPRSEGSAIPEGETRQTSNHTFTKHLPAIAFSHYESRDEVRELDYSPCVNRETPCPPLPPLAAAHAHCLCYRAGRPVDLNVPLRVRRMGRQIRAILCITMYTVRPLPPRIHARLLPAHFPHLNERE